MPIGERRPKLIDAGCCRRCKRKPCKDSCALGCVTISEFGYPVFHEESEKGKCFGCGDCAGECQYKAIEMQ